MPLLGQGLGRLLFLARRATAPRGDAGVGHAGGVTRRRARNRQGRGMLVHVAVALLCGSFICVALFMTRASRDVVITIVQKFVRCGVASAMFGIRLRVHTHIFYSKDCLYFSIAAVSGGSVT